MTAMKSIESWALHAYVDGELDGAERLAVEQLLTEDGAARAAVETYRRQREALKRTFDPVLAEPVPASLTAAVRARGTWRDRPFMHMAAAVLLLVAGGLLGWFAGHDPAGSRAETLAEWAIEAHQIFAAEVRHPVEVAASDRDHLQAWLSKRVGTAFTIPDLSEEGYTLLGGRLLAAGDRPAAQLMYEDAASKRITVFLAANDDKAETSLQVEEKGQLIACYWLSHQIAFAVAGEMDKGPMMQLARVIYDKFEG